MSFKLKTLCAFTIIVMLGITPVCYAETAADKTSIDEVKKETQDLLKTLNSYTVEQKDEAIRKTKTALDNLDKRIDSLQTRIDKNWDQMDKAARAKARSNLKALRMERTQLAEWYGSLKNSTVDAWEHMKNGFAKSYESLNEAWEKSVKEFRTNKNK
ncbi:MAG: SNF7 family protein [Gammaproteobacteria bacterium]|nr:SNF7 family protein [Gammaproteobacteria bacterium]